MVASSVVTTILVLNYHHRASDTHEMPEWVGKYFLSNIYVHFKLWIDNQVRIIFLRWIPWLLRMSRPGMDLSLKSIMMQRKLKVVPHYSFCIIIMIINNKGSWGEGQSLKDHANNQCALCGRRLHAQVSTIPWQSSLQPQSAAHTKWLSSQKVTYNQSFTIYCLWFCIAIWLSLHFHSFSFSDPWPVDMISALVDWMNISYILGLHQKQF